jgi:regulatory protein
MTSSDLQATPRNTDPEKYPAESADTVNPRDLRLAAMDLLARREHLQRELQRKLRKRFADHTLIDDIIRQLAEEGLQSDERFCESYVNQRSSKGYGPERIRMELRQKGAPADLAALALDGLEVDWLELARGTRSKKFGDALPVEFREKSRQLRFLQYRGFSGDTISRVLDFDED